MLVVRNERSKPVAGIGAVVEVEMPPPPPLLVDPPPSALLLLLSRGRRDRERNGSEWIVCPYQIILGPGTNITRAEHSSKR